MIVGTGNRAQGTTGNRDEFRLLPGADTQLHARHIGQVQNDDIEELVAVDHLRAIGTHEAH